jgi:hypothetical protein
MDAKGVGEDAVALGETMGLLGLFLPHATIMTKATITVSVMRLVTRLFMIFLMFLDCTSP